MSYLRQETGEMTLEPICTTFYSWRLLQYSPRTSMFIHVIACSLLKVIYWGWNHHFPTLAYSDAASFMVFFIFIVFFTLSIEALFLYYCISTSPPSLWLHLSGNNLKLLCCGKQGDTNLSMWGFLSRSSESPLNLRKSSWLTWTSCIPSQGLWRLLLKKGGEVGQEGWKRRKCPGS